MRHTWAVSVIAPTLIAAAGCSHAAHRPIPPQHAAPAVTSAGPVVWVDAPAQAVTSSGPLPAGPRYDACTAAQLSATAGPLSEDGERYIKITNASTEPCTLVGHPANAVGVQADGKKRPIDTRPTDGDLDLPANLNPGYSGFVIIGSTTQCPHPSRMRLTELSFEVPAGGRLAYRFPSAHAFRVGCGVGMGSLGLLATHEPDSPIDQLDVTASMPRSVLAGTITTYTVTLHNPTAGSIELTPCPAYIEYLESSPITGSAIKRYYLNCGGAGGAIPARGSVTFTMKIPTSRIPGTARWGWALQSSDVQVGGNVTILRR